MANAPQQKPGGFGRASRTLSLWVLVFLVPFIFFQMTSGRNEQSPMVDYSIYDTQLSSDNVARVTIVGGSKINGEFKNRVLVEGREVRRFSVLLPVPNSDAEVDRLRAKQVTIKSELPRVSMGAILLQMLPWIIIIGIWVFLLRQMQAGGNKAFSFGKSKAKLLSGDTQKITFADVAGQENAKREVGELVDFLRAPERYRKLGA